MSLSDVWRFEKFSFFAESCDSPVICTKVTLEKELHGQKRLSIEFWTIQLTQAISITTNSSGLI
jgi:hypothetical protein